MPAIQSMILPPEEREDYFSLTFRTLKAPVQKFTLHTSSVRTVAQVKRHLARVSNIPVANMRLVLGGKGLVDTKLIGDYAIPEDAVIQIISKPPVAGEADMAEMPAAVAASDANPLSSVLNQESEREVPKEEVAMSTSDKTDSSESDDAMCKDPEDLAEKTREELGDRDSAFRTKFRELAYSHFGQGQGEAVDSLLCGTFDLFAKN
ncbi:hypothetical protein IWW37_004607 [Coemansia sp. RSA 2050]|nr:hypothetical protein IWW37_004607 [Coemansia sp. RSA 2050]KAJ2731173.1 hypothetical protein IW152_004721 [Coemansia sp. BCRC 34962]